MPKWAFQLIHKHYNDDDAKLIIDAFFNYYTPRFGTISDTQLLQLAREVLAYERN